MHSGLLLSSAERISLLNHLLNEQPEKISVRQTAKRLGLSPAFVSGFVKRLKKEKILNAKPGLNPRTRALRILLNVETILSAKAVEKIRAALPEATGIGVYGSWSKGTNAKGSDIDLWIKTRHESAESGKGRAVRAAKNSLNAEASVLFLNPKSTENIRKKEGALYCGLLDSITLWGESID